MYQNGGGGMAQFGQMGLNQFSQMQTPQAGGPVMMPMMMMPPQMYGQNMMPNQPMMMMPVGGNMAQSQIMQNNNQSNQNNQQNDDIQQKFGQNQGMQNENMMRRNQSQGNIYQNMPVSKPSEGFQVQDRYGKNDKQKEYAQMLEFQLNLKKQKQHELKQLEQASIENLKNERVKSQVYAAQGQLVRDQFGNIINSKLNPSNPNYQPIDWFSHVAHKDQFQNQLAQSISVPSLQNVPDLAMYDPELKRQREIGNRLQTAKSQVMNMNQDKIARAQEAFENSIPQQNFQRPPPMNLAGDVDLVKMRKRQQALELQREQMQQIEEKKRQKQLRSIQEQRERDLEDLKVQREVDELNKRLLNDFHDSKLGNKNLHETNFDINGLQVSAPNRRSQQDVEISISQSQIQEAPQPPPAPVRSSLKKQVVINDFDNDQQNVRVEQRIVRELPIEITTTVKETLNNELFRLRNEMQMHSNSLGEQILGMKSQLMKANERRSQAEDDVKKLREELKKTQYIDEIRQRELYNAFVLTDKPKIHTNSNTQRIYDADLKFELPTRPRPYYNMQDPYLDNYKQEFEKDNHEILQNQTKHIPVGEYDYSANAVSDKRKMDDQYFIDKQEFDDLEKKAYNLDKADIADLPDDFLNKQNLYYSKLPLEENNDEIGDYKDYLMKNQTRLDKLNELDTLERRGELDKLDEALFDLASHSNQESRFKKRYEQEENLKDIEDFIDFQTKLSRYS
ncbi:hypothetical protein TTHERM_00442840 (macronuclear) [Tetrahymena thermophila SB210]|uniref:Uncharacterized protein n=1 Tax=Tetrahymena thermophila (strain SB210) TaxID=312017 RepID=I7MGW7_TETTS|nr:hypothetical protein TTHERM_00442840 [Tetrahymena thermophila SB210]EAR85534.1 hypothetical protein TTHERM_00442840 [Tetrahymena thermophila SB210]|eukprot:XP_001033197.1 hypothetical protein TTHERM_00442840 [Tetrahymena thermophila SB210]